MSLRIAQPSAAAATPRPGTLALFFSMKCNYACFFCTREPNSHYTDLQLEQLEQLRPAIRDATMVDITGWGEPFMYPRIAEAIRFITEINPRGCISVTTNGSHLRESYAELLSRNLHHLVFSLNAATQATYERDMVHGRWTHVLGNIERARRHIPGSKVTFSFVAHRENIHEFPELVRLAARYGVGTVSLTHLIVTNPDHVTRSLWFDKARANAAVDEARREGTRLGVAVAARRFEGAHATPPAGPGCTSPFTETFIGVDGRVGPCCYAGDHAMGNAFREGFDAVWNGEAYRALRRERHFPECRECFMHASLEDLSTHMGKDLGPTRYTRLPRFTVVVPIGADASVEALEASLQSLAWQTYPVFDRRLVLEGARQDLPAPLRERLEAHGGTVVERGGPGALAMAGGLEDAPGAFVALLQPGTCWHPEKLERTLMAFLAAGDGCQVVGHRAIGLRPGAPSHGAVIRTATAAREPALAWSLLAGERAVVAGPAARLLVEPLDVRAAGVPQGPRHAWLAEVARQLNQTGRAALAAGQPAAAGAAFMSAAEVSPRFAESWSNLALLEWTASRPKSACELMAKAVELHPENPVYRSNARAMLAALTAGC